MQVAIVASCDHDVQIPNQKLMERHFATINGNEPNREREHVLH